MHLGSELRIHITAADDDSSVRVLFFDLPNNVPAGNFRQADVHQHDVDLVFVTAVEIDGLFTV